MKKGIIILLFLAVSNLTLAQNSYLQEKYEDKIASYQVMEKVGTNLAIAGGIVTIAGVLVLSKIRNGPDTLSKNSDAKTVLGILLIGKGIPVATFGLVFRTIGINSQRKYEKRLNRLSLGFLPTPKGSGFTLAYRF